MGIILLSIVFGLVAVAAFSGTPAVTAYMTFPLSFEAINEFELNPQSLMPSPSTNTRTVEATTRDLTATEPQLAPDLAHVAQTAQRWFQGAIAAGLAQGAPACRSAGCATNSAGGRRFRRWPVPGPDRGGGGRSVDSGRRSRSAATGSAGSVVFINPNRSVRSTSSAGGGSSTNTAGVFGVAGPNQSARGTSRTAAVPVSSTR
jgi:hypothetical protein